MENGKQKNIVRSKSVTHRIALLGASLCLSLSLEAQNASSVHGTVVDSEGQPVIGATIQDKATKQGTVTDVNGNFTLNVAQGSTLHISYVGSVPQDVRVTGPSLSVTLKDEAHSLNDVVVIGYGVQRKKLVTGATVQVKGDDISKLGTVNPLTALQSSTPRRAAHAVVGYAWKRLQSIHQRHRHNRRLTAARTHRRHAG